VKVKEILSAGGRATIGVLFGLALLDSVDNALFHVFLPEIRTSLGLGSDTVVIVGALAGVMVALGALPLGVLGDRRRRTTIAGLCTLAWAVSAAFLGLVQNLWQVVVVRILAGVGKANEGPIQISILSDAYPPAGRGRVFGLHRAGLPLGSLIGPLLAAVFAALVPGEQGQWRWAFAFLAVAGLILGVAVLRLREPVRGRFEGTDGQAEPPVSLGMAFARLRKIRTVNHVMVALGAFGLCVTTVPNYLSLIVNDHLGQEAGARGVIGAVGAVGAVAGAALGGAYSDRLFRRSPAACLHLAAGALGVLGVGFAAMAYAPDVVTFTVVGVVTQAALYAGLVPLSLVVASITPPAFRATAFALVGLYLAVVGGLGGAVVTNVVAGLWGARVAVAAVAPIASVAAGVVLARGARHLRADTPVRT
jgi:MFS family permease